MTSVETRRMREPKVLSVFGIRPEVVKMAPSVQAEEDDWVLLQGETTATLTSGWQRVAASDSERA